MSLTVLKSQGSFFVVQEQQHEFGPIARKAGFAHNPRNDTYWTKQYSVAAKLYDFADEFTKRRLKKKIIIKETWPFSIDDPKLLPFQPRAIRFALERNRSYLALDPGLGKTICAINILKQLTKCRNTAAVFMCPPFLVLNVLEEFSKWWPEASPAVYQSGLFFNSPLTILPTSLFAREHTLKELMYTFGEKFKGRYKVVILDEAHQFNSATSLRTESLLGAEDPKKEWRGVHDYFDHIVYMSGTPFQRPIELFPILNRSAPETIDFKNRYAYGMRYCGARRNDFGKWDFSGASSVKDLSKRIRGKFMLRMRKDVLGLPPISENILFIGENLKPKLAALDREIARRFSPEDLVKAAIAGKHNIEGELHTSTYRKLLGLEKVPSIVRVTKEILQDDFEKIILFAWHKEVVKELEHGLRKYKPLILTRDFSDAKRHERVKEFQRNKSRRLIIGNTKTAGIGYTLTKATTVLLGEPSWNPSDNEQAYSRAHRHGQTGIVKVRYLVYKNSIDRNIVETFLRKQHTQNAL